MPKIKIGKKKEEPKEEKATNPLVNEHGEILVGVKTEKLADGEIEGYSPLIKDEA